MLMFYHLHPHKTYADYKLDNIELINTDQQMCMLRWYIETKSDLQLHLVKINTLTVPLKNAWVGIKTYP